jgi:hypothetical protein
VRIRYGERGISGNINSPASSIAGTSKSTNRVELGTPIPTGAIASLAAQTGKRRNVAISTIVAGHGWTAPSANGGRITSATTIADTTVFAARIRMSLIDSAGAVCLKRSLQSRI